MINFSGKKVRAIGNGGGPTKEKYDDEYSDEPRRADHT